jgi:hypothetical protein
VNTNSAGKGDRARGNSKEERKRYQDNYVAIFGDKGITSTAPVKGKRVKLSRNPSSSELTHRELAKTDTGIRI